MEGKWSGPWEGLDGKIIGKVRGVGWARPRGKVGRLVEKVWEQEGWRLEGNRTGKTGGLVGKGLGRLEVGGQ